MNTFRDVGIGFVTIVVSHLLGATFSEEIRHRLERLPRWLLRLATRSVEQDLRDELRTDLEAELDHIFHESEGLPITRFLRGGRFAFSLLLAAPKLSGRHTWVVVSARLFCGGFGLGGATFFTFALVSGGSESAVGICWSTLVGRRDATSVQYILNCTVQLTSIVTQLSIISTSILIASMALVSEGRWRGERKPPLRRIRAMWIFLLITSSVCTAAVIAIYYDSIVRHELSGTTMELRSAVVVWLLFAISYFGGRVALDRLDRAAAAQEAINAESSKTSG